MRAALIREARIFLAALRFFTRCPVPAWAGFDPAREARIPRHQATVGIVVGGFGAAVSWALAPILPWAAAVLLGMAATIWLTGAFHEDGFADACDGLGGAVTRERALEIMRDSRLGTYGTVGLVLVLALKAALLIALDPMLAVAALILGHAASRAAISVMLASARYLRDSGIAKPVAEGVDAGDLAISLIMGLVAGVPLLLVAGPGALVAALAGTAFGFLLMRRTVVRRLGGYTGDCLGAVQQMAELGGYLGLVAWLLS